MTSLLLALALALPAPADWVPVRWPWTDPATLELTAGTPVNCLLVEESGAPEFGGFVKAARERGIISLAVLAPGAEAAARARNAVEAGAGGIVLEGVFAEAAAVRDALPDTVVIEMTPRSRLRLDRPVPVLATNQAVWPGIEITADGHAKAGPTGSPWIDTNAGFLRTVRAWGHPTIWVGNRPPENSVITARRYLQVIADAAMAGARWVIAFDPAFAAALREGDAKARSTWTQITSLLGFLEKHRTLLSLPPTGKFALVQDSGATSLLSGGVLDMIATKHTPVRPVPHPKLTPQSLSGVAMAVNVDASVLSDRERDILRAYTRGGGTLLTGPPGWQKGAGDRITLEKEELERLNDIWKEINSMIGRTNLGARLFNVSSMLSHLLEGPGGRGAVIHLVNYSEFPVENVTVHTLGTYAKAWLIAPGQAERPVEVYKTDEGTGVDLHEVGIWATVRME